MKKWLRRLRGALGMGVTWAAGWSVVGTIAWWTLDVLFLGVTTAGPLTVLVTFLVTFGVIGFISGAIFSVVLGLAEGRRRFDQMSLPRFAAWGALGSALLSVGVLAAESWQMPGTELALLGFITLMGAGSAAGSLAIARRDDDRALLDAGAEVSEIGLTAEERLNLLG
jgi:hypothetical protein